MPVAILAGWAAWGYKDRREPLALFGAGPNNGTSLEAQPRWSREAHSLPLGGLMPWTKGRLGQAAPGSPPPCQGEEKARRVIRTPKDSSLLATRA